MIYYNQFSILQKNKILMMKSKTFNNKKKMGNRKKVKLKKELWLNLNKNYIPCKKAKMKIYNCFKQTILINKLSFLDFI